MSEALQQQLKDALGALPRTAAGIADHLIERDVRGYRQSHCICPLARLLRSELCVPLAYVDSDYISVVDDQGERATVKTPKGVRTFLYAFDVEGQFEELEDTGPPTREEQFMDLYGDIDG